MESSLIASLHDDCLCKIFSYLTNIDDIISFGQVCKRWEALGTNLGNFCKLINLQPSIIRRSEDVKKIFSIFGRHVVNIDIQCCLDIEVELSSIAHHCEKLKKLTLTLMPSSHQVIEEDHGHLLNSLFTQCRTLRDICIKFITQVGGENFPWDCLFALPEEMSRLALYGCIWMLRPHLTPNIPRFATLTQLHLEHFIIAANEYPDLGILENLRELYLNNIDCHDVTFVMNVSHLRRLEILSISHLNCLDFNDALLIRIMDNCTEIRELKLLAIEPDELTNRGLLYIRDSSKLEKLELEGARSITDVAFSRMTSLRELRCSGCDSLGEEHVVAIVKRALKIAYLDILKSHSRELVTQIHSIMEDRQKTLTLNIWPDIEISSWAKTQDLAPWLILVPVADDDGDATGDYESEDDKDTNPVAEDSSSSDVDSEDGYNSDGLSVNDISFLFSL